MTRGDECGEDGGVSGGGVILNIINDEWVIAAELECEDGAGTISECVLECTADFGAASEKHAVNIRVIGECFTGFDRPLNKIEDTWR